MQKQCIEVDRGVVPSVLATRWAEWLCPHLGVGDEVGRGSRHVHRGCGKCLVAVQRLHVHPHANLGGGGWQRGDWITESRGAMKILIY